MPEIHLPKRIVFEKNSLLKFDSEGAEKTILICDSEIIKNSGKLDILAAGLSSKSSQVHTIFNTNIHELYNLASEEYFSCEAERIVAVGSGAAIDCAMLLSHESGAGFTAVPCACASAMTDFETSDYYTYRHSPDTIILDPVLTRHLPSSMIAYDAMASFAYAVDSLDSIDNVIIKSLAIHGAVGIYRNIIPAYRGEISSLERLLYSMYLCTVSHRNSANIHSSHLSRVSRFFADFGYSKPSVCALIIPNIMEYEEPTLRDGLFEIAKAVGLAQPDEDPSFADIKLIDEIRRIQACVGIPRAVSGFNLTEEAYQTRRIHSDIPDDLLDLCYYGSFKFLKM